MKMMSIQLGKSAYKDVINELDESRTLNADHPRSQPPGGIVQPDVRWGGELCALRPPQRPPHLRAPPQPLHIVPRQGRRAEDRAQGCNSIDI